MKKEDLETGRKLQNRIEYVEAQIKRLKNDELTDKIEVYVIDNSNVIVKERDTYTEKTNTNLEYLNQLYRDNVLRTLENCKQELENEFELLGK